MMRSLGLGVCLALAVSIPAGGQDEEPLVLDFSQANSSALHLPVGDQRVAITPAFEDYSFMMFDICDAVGLDVADEEECSIFPMNGDLGGNAIATILDGNRIIVYDRQLSPIIGGDGAEAVIAHELAHHYCGHLEMTDGHQLELEADAFAGAAMKLMGRSLESALSAAPILSERPSISHPEREMRIQAITRGWNDPVFGTSCGGRKGQR